jgi:hypothetical protein
MPNLPPRHSRDASYGSGDSARSPQLSGSLSPFVPSSPALHSSLPPRSHINLGIFLSGKDPYVPGEAIMRYVKLYNYPHVSVVHYPNMTHAQFISSPAAMDDIVKLLQATT